MNYEKITNKTFHMKSKLIKYIEYNETDGYQS